MKGYKKGNPVDYDQFSALVSLPKKRQAGAEGFVESRKQKNIPKHKKLCLGI